MKKLFLATVALAAFGAPAFAADLGGRGYAPVSYTHLTLPTIYSV